MKDDRCVCKFICMYIYIYMIFPLFFGGGRCVLILMAIVCDSCWWLVLSFLDGLGVGVVGSGFFWSLGCLLLYLLIYQHVVIGVVAGAIIVLVIVVAVLDVGVGPFNRLQHRSPSTTFLNLFDMFVLCGTKTTQLHWLPMGYSWATRYATSKSWLCGSMPKLLTVQLKRRSEAASCGRSGFSMVLIFPSWSIRRKDLCSFPAFPMVKFGTFHGDMLN